MIFSNADVSEFVRENFAAAWENVRPVPIVEIDFGDGRKVKRTVNGNVATYICAPDGRIVDAIPGVYSTEAYLARLRSALTLYRASLADFEGTVLKHHRTARLRPRIRVLRPADLAKDIVEAPIKADHDNSKGSVELGIREIFAAGKKIRVPDAGKYDTEFSVRATLEETLLEADSEFNRREREPGVHSILSERIYRPEEITKRLYRDVLHVDLDDPNLGLLTSAFNGGAYETR